MSDTVATDRAHNATDEITVDSANMEPDAEPTDHGLWRGDTGVLREQSRRALLKLVKGPYLSGASTPLLWSALLADERAVRSRLHELFLELVVDREGEFAFVRNVDTTELQAPSAVRTEALTFIDTAVLLVLRQMLLNAEGEERVIVGHDEVFEQLQAYRTPDRDETDFAKRFNSSWDKMRNKLRVVHTAGEGRVEISPVLRLIVDAEQVKAIGAEYRRIADGGGLEAHGLQAQGLQAHDADAADPSGDDGAEDDVS